MLMTTEVSGRHAMPGEENHPSFSPNGQQIVFSETVLDVATLMIVNSDGSGLHALTTGTANDWNPSWSLSGILFSSNRGPSGHWSTWRVLPDGSALTPMGNFLALDPVQGPSGQIVFSDETGGTGAASAISLVDPTSGRKSVVSTVQGFLTPIQIRDVDTTNPINPKSNGKITVAVLSTPDFNAPSMIDTSSLRFGRTGDEQSLAFCDATGTDVNGDGRPDLVCHFDTQAAGFVNGDTVGILRGRTVPAIPGDSGVAIEGRDSVTIVPRS